jgi:hypothetical protein
MWVSWLAVENLWLLDSSKSKADWDSSLAGFCSMIASIPCRSSPPYLACAVEEANREPDVKLTSIWSHRSWDGDWSMSCVKFEPRIEN